MSQITCKHQGFTLAEVLIALGVIGVVAAISLPTIITNINELRNSERQANIAQKITQAMEQMRAHGLLNTQYPTTEAFVDELQKYLKITKRCDKDHLTECWPTDKVTDSAGKEYNIKDATIGKDLGRNTITNNVGLILADGASIILNYDNTSEGIDVGNPVVSENKSLPVGRGQTKEFPYTTNVTGAIDFVMDVNGKNKPNREKDTNGKQYDIRSFKIAHFSESVPWENGPAGKILYIGGISQSQAVDCRSSNADSKDYQTYCGPHLSGYQYDRWAGAKKVCKDATYGKGSLPSVTKLQEIQSYQGKYRSLGSTNSYWFWSSEEAYQYPQTQGRFVYFSGAVEDRKNKDSDRLKVVCASN